MTEPSCGCVSDTKDTTRSTLPPRATAEGRRSLRSSCLVLEMRDFTEDTNDLRACVVKTIVLTWDFIKGGGGGGGGGSRTIFTYYAHTL